MIKPSWNGSADPSNRPCATRTRKMRTKKKMLIPFYLQQNTALLETKTMKVVRTTRKTTASTTAKTPCSTIPKKTRKKIYRGTKANCRRQNRRRVQRKNIKKTMEQVPRISTETATTEVTVIPVP